MNMDNNNIDNDAAANRFIMDDDVAANRLAPADRSSKNSNFVRAHVDATTMASKNEVDDASSIVDDIGKPSSNGFESANGSHKNGDVVGVGHVDDSSPGDMVANMSTSSSLGLLSSMGLAGRVDSFARSTEANRLLRGTWSLGSMSCPPSAAELLRHGPSGGGGGASFHRGLGGNTGGFRSSGGGSLASANATWDEFELARPPPRSNLLQSMSMLRGKGSGVQVEPYENARKHHQQQQEHQPKQQEEQQEEKEEEDRQQQNAFSESSFLPLSFDAEVAATDRDFKRLAVALVMVWVALLILVFRLAPVESYQTLNDTESRATLVVTSIMLFANLSRVIPFVLRSRGDAFSGYVTCVIVVQLIAMATNALMLAGPAPVVRDPVTRQRVHLLRWTEWAPLAGGMMFLVEGVDNPHPEHGQRIAYRQGAAFFVTTLAGLALPFLTGGLAWARWPVLSVSCGLFATMYVRIRQKRLAFRKMERGRFNEDVDTYERARLSLRCITTLAVVWSLLVATYFAGWLGKACFPMAADDSFPTIADLVFELCSKGLLLAVITDVHDAVFDDKLRIKRRLRELWRMMSAVWVSSSDVIAVSIRSSTEKGGGATVMVSPTLELLERAIFARQTSRDMTGRRRGGPGVCDAKAVVFELDSTDLSISPGQTSSFSYSNGSEGGGYKLRTNGRRRVNPKRVHPVELRDIDDDYGMTRGATAESQNLSRPGRLNEGIVVMGELLVRAWRTTGEEEEETLVHDVERIDPHTGKVRRVRFEAKVTRLDERSVLVVARDVTDRFRRFRAEKLVLMERASRVKDTEANRFTKHEVKNGLLNAIGLCDMLRDSSSAGAALTSGAMDDNMVAATSVASLRSLLPAPIGKNGRPKPMAATMSAKGFYWSEATAATTLTQLPQKNGHPEVMAEAAAARPSSHPASGAEKRSNSETMMAMLAQSSHRKKHISYASLASRLSKSSCQTSVANYGSVEGSAEATTTTLASSSATMLAASSTKNKLEVMPTTTFAQSWYSDPVAKNSSPEAMATTLSEAPHPTKKHKPEVVVATTLGQSSYPATASMDCNLEAMASTNLTESSHPTTAGKKRTLETMTATALAQSPHPSSSAKKSKLQGIQGQEVPPNVNQCMAELDLTLREVLDTILAQSMARDVMHGSYEPKVERVDIPTALYGVRGQQPNRNENERFPLTTNPSPLPLFMLDPQLFRFVHKNAISNACKYGKKGGPVVTEISLENNNGIMMKVINLPGPFHESLVQMGDSARKAVFEPGKRLHPDLRGASHGHHCHSQTHSSGDGAWIMKKCARTLGGDCSINFEASRTVFSLRCPAQPIADAEEVDFSNFRIPENVWGIAIDDSKIQRTLLKKMLVLCGVRDDKIRILGGSNSEIMQFENTVINTVRENPGDFILVIADENLDIEGDGNLLTISGSLCVERVRNRLSPKEEARMLALIRSANDSKEDIELYTSRAQGYLPKAPMKRENVLEIVAPWWIKRFPGVCDARSRQRMSAGTNLAELSEMMVSSSEIEQTLENIHVLFLQGDASSILGRRAVIWEKLHKLKGDIKTLREEDVCLTAALDGIDQLLSKWSTQGAEDLLESWMVIRNLVISIL